MKFIFLSLLLFFSEQDFAFSTKFKIVDSKTGKGLPFATVMLIKQQKGNFADSLGYVVLDISNCSMNDSVEIRSLGYKSSIICLSMINNEGICELTQDKPGFTSCISHA